MKAAEVVDFVRRERLVPVVRAETAELAKQAAVALVEGGVRVLEITLTVPGGIDVIRELAQMYHQPGKEPVALVGAGTVLNVKQAKACVEAGALFIVSPGLDEATVEFGNDQDIAVMPGALTPTEVIAANRLGAKAVKIFPCSAMGGAPYLKALKAPLPDVELLPTGGVKLENLGDFIRAGAVGVGIGAALVDIKLLKESGPGALADKARAFVRAAAEFS